MKVIKNEYVDDNGVVKNKDLVGSVSQPVIGGPATRIWFGEDGCPDRGLDAEEVAAVNAALVR